MTDAARSYSLGPRLPRWTPETWDDLAAAVDAGLLDETHWVELKESVPPASRGANLELAKDIASLAADGGLLIVGVADDAGKAGAVVGTDGVSSLRDRIDQVARSRVHPPLAVSCSEMREPTAPDKDRGCLIVSVAASPDAPHMVDKNYWGRGDRGKRKLEDVEVQRYFAERRLRSRQAASGLHEWIDSPSVRRNSSTDGRLYVHARPQGGQADQFSELLFRPDNHLAEAMQEAAGAGMTNAGLQLPITRALYRYGGHHLEGYTSDDPANRGLVSEEGLVVAEVHKDGSVNVLHGGATSDRGDRGRTTSVSMLRDIVHQTVLLAGRLGSEAGYYGTWDIGVHITHIKGAGDHHRTVYGGVKGAVWLQDTYEEVLMVTSDELLEAPAQVVHRLLMPLALPLQAGRELTVSLGLDTPQ